MFVHFSSSQAPQRRFANKATVFNHRHKYEYFPCSASLPTSGTFVFGSEGEVGKVGRLTDGLKVKKKIMDYYFIIQQFFEKVKIT